MLRVLKGKGNTHHIELTSPRQESDEELFFAALDEVLNLDNFKIILEVRGEKSFSPEAKRRLGIWFKENKGILKERCQGLIRVSENAKAKERLSARALSLAMPCPYRVFDNLKEAQKWCQS